MKLIISNINTMPHHQQLEQVREDGKADQWAEVSESLLEEMERQGGLYRGDYFLCREPLLGPDHAVPLYYLFRKLRVTVFGTTATYSQFLEKPDTAHHWHR